MDRRSFLRGALSALAAPAIVKCTSLMPVRGIIMPVRPVLIRSTVYEDLVDITRRAFVPRLFLQLRYDESPLGSFLVELEEAA